MHLTLGQCRSSGLPPKALVLIAEKRELVLYVLLVQGNQCQPLGQPAAASAAGQPANGEPAAAVMVNPPQPVLPPIEQPLLGYTNLLGHVDDDFLEGESARQGMPVIRDVLPSVMQSVILLLSRSCILSVSQSVSHS